MRISAYVAPFLAVWCSAAAAQVIAIEHASVIPMDRQVVLTDQTVVVIGTQISQIGPSSRTAVPERAQRIDARGKFLVPGLTDAHVHLYDAEGFASYLAYGVTSIINLHGSPDVLRWREAQRAGRLDGPTIYSAGPTVNGYPPGNPLFVALRSASDAIAEARAQKAAGYDFIKAYSFLDPPVYEALLNESRRAAIAVIGHIPLQIGYAGVLRQGQKNIAHVEEFFQEGDVADDSMPVIAGRVRAAGVSVTPNLVAYADYLRNIRDFPAVMADPEMRYASAAQYSEKIPTSNRALNRPNLEAFASFLEQRRQRFRRLSRILADSGVPLLVGTDTEIFGFPGHSAYLELLELREAGLTPFQVLASATRSAGDLLASSGQATAQERTGRIAAGYRADLLLLDQNPLEDIRHVRTIRGVMARGRWYSIGRITAMRDSVAARNTPRRAFVATFDSTLVKARNPRAAAQMLRQFLAENPTAVPLAELVWRGYGRLRFSDDTTSSIAIRRAMTEALPQSLLAWSELARGLLASGDTAGALQAFDRSLALSPRNSSVRDTDEKVKAKRSGSPESAVGTYRFETFTSRGKQYAPTVAITRTAVAYGGTMQINGASPVGLTELVVGRDQIWATAAIDGRDLELRFDRRSLMGSWVHGFVTNGTLRGVRGTGATPRHSSTSQTSSGSFRP